MANPTTAVWKGVGYLMALQVLSRVLTFSLNQWLIRFVSPDVLGRASIQMEMLLNGLLLLSRESIRSTLLLRSRPASTSIKEWQAVLNLSWLTLPLGCLWTAALLLVKGNEAVTVYAVAALGELVVEPLYIVFHQLQWLKPRVWIEGTAVLMKTLVCFLLVLRIQQEGGDGVMAFAWAQVAYSVTVIVGYLWAMHRALDKSREGDDGEKEHPFHSWLDFLPRPIRLEGEQSKSYWFHAEWLRMMLTLSVQSLVQFLVTELDKLVLSLWSSASEQGRYALLSNYASLIVRIVFFPIEEATRSLLTRLLPSEELRVRQLARLHLKRIVRSYVYLGLLATSLGPAYGPQVLHLVAGTRWQSPETHSVLIAYCYLIPCLGLNGILEAYAHLLWRSQKDVYVRMGWMLVWCLLQMGVAYLLMQVWGWKQTGVVLSSLVQMAVRSGWAWWQLEAYWPTQERMGWRFWIPSVRATLSWWLVVQAWLFVRPLQAYGWWLDLMGGILVAIASIGWFLLVVDPWILKLNLKQPEQDTLLARQKMKEERKRKKQKKRD